MGECAYAQAQKYSVFERLQCVKLVLTFRKTCSTVITGKKLLLCTVVLFVLYSFMSNLRYSEFYIKRDGSQKTCESKLKWK